jgi:hypothetical protein
MRLTFDEALKFRAHPEAQVRTAARAVHIFVRGFGRLDDYGSRFSLDALFEGILHEVAAKRYDDGYLIVNVKRSVRVWRRVEYFDEKGSGVGRPSFGSDPFVIHRVHFIQDTMFVAWLR